MYTRCTDCRTLFRVTREQLNAARGQVRCGRCGNVFDALESLEEELLVPPVVEAQGEEEATAGEELTGDAELIESPDVARGALHRSHSALHRSHSALHRSHTGLWGVIAMLMLVVLGAQLVHANRAALAENPQFGPVLSTTYERLGRPLVIDDRFDLSAFALLHHELVTHPRDAGALHLSAVLHNAASFAQPWPLIELRLEDRFGGVVAARRLRVDEYLRNPPRDGEPIGANARRAIEIEIVDPGHDAVGFSIDFCIDTRTGFRCGNSSRGT